MYHSSEIKDKAILLRKKGYSIKEVSKLLDIAVGTSSRWLRAIELSNQAKKRLRRRRLLGQYKAIQTRKANRKLAQAELEKEILNSMKNIKFSPDPKMVEVFMSY